MKNFLKETALYVGMFLCGVVISACIGFNIVPLFIGMAIGRKLITA